MGAHVRHIMYDDPDLLPAELLRLQQEQHEHDMRNHFEIVCLHKTERLKHYGLHFAKYVGRLARGSDESKSVERTLVDTLLVALSAANALEQDLSRERFNTAAHSNDTLKVFASAAGQFADACEKIDHLEEFLPQARRANRDVMQWVIATAQERCLDINCALSSRRAELAGRHVYVSNR